MTIKEYINIHTNSSFIKKVPVIIKPFSLCGKSHYDKQQQISVIYEKQKENGIKTAAELWFYDLKKLAEKVDFNMKIKKVEVNYSSLYSDDADIEIVFFVSDTVFLELTKGL